MRWICSAAATIVIVMSQAPAPPAQVQQPRDVRLDRPAGVGSIGGRILDRDTQQPVRWARVTVAQASRRLQLVTSADADGRFLFDTLRPGAYMVFARKAGYVPLAYGARKPRDAGAPVNVAAGTTVNADVLLSRGGAIEGRILNEYGDPAQDVGMQALRIGYDSTGRRTLPAGLSTRTDDLGWFRLHSLPPGMYLLEAFRAYEMDSRDGRERPADVAVAAISTLFPGLLADPNQRQTPVRATPDGRFTLRSILGPRLFRIVVSAPWALQAVMFDGRDVTDAPLDVRQQRDARPLRIVVTNRTGSVSGSVGAIADATNTQVVAFAEDEKQWVFDSRYTRVADVRADGSFGITGLLPGRYLIVHVPDLEPGAAGDAEVLRQLRSSAVPVVVTDGGETQVQVPFARPQ